MNLPLIPADTTIFDVIALGWFLALWGAFNLIQDHVLRGSVNRHLIQLRIRWMERMLDRDVRLPDAMLLGHSMQSCSFFASATVLVLAALLGSFANADHAREMLSDLSFAVQTSRALFEVKLLTLGCVFFFAFFKFTWALREFNYVIALIGAAPPPPPPAERRAIAEPIAGMLTLALSEFNSGIRAYYFALAALNWVIDPRLFILATAGVTAILSRRQVWSRAERLLRDQIDRGA